MARPHPDPADRDVVRSFPTTFRGYDQGAVRQHLELLATHLADRDRRIASLEAEVAALRAAPPERAPLDEHALMATLGEEAARLLATARDGAQQMKARAEERVAELLRDAQADAARIREDAELDAARRRQDAAAAAEAEVEQAKQQGRSMLAEAQAIRERVLNDLANRRKKRLAQLELLRKGRDRLLEAYDHVERALEESRAVLRASDEDFRDAPSDPPTGEVEIITASTPPPAPAVAARPAPVAVVETARTVEVVETVETVETVVVVESVAEPEADVDGGVDASGPVAPVTSAAGSVGDSADPSAADDLEQDLEQYGEQVADTAMDHGADAVADTPAAPVSVTAPIVDQSVDPVVLEPAAPVAVAVAPAEEAVAPAPADGPDAGLAPDASVAADPAPAEPVAAEPVAGDVAAAGEGRSTGAEAPTTDGLPAGTGAAEAAGAPSESAGPKAHDRSAVDDLFARIRAVRVDAVARAHAVLDGEDDVVADESTGDEPAPSASTPAAAARPVADAERGPGDVTDLDELARSLARRLKRALADEQNELLDRLRRGSKQGGPALADPVPHAERYRAAAEDDLWTAAAAGAEGSGLEPLAAAASLDAGNVLDRLLDRLGERLSEPLRTRLEGVLADTTGDAEEVANAARAVYREWKLQRIDPVAESLVRTAHELGASAGRVTLPG